MKYIIITLTLTFSTVSAQSSYDKRLIKEIEEASTWSETFAGIEMKHDCKVTLNSETGKITVLDSDDMDKHIRKSELSFYLDDIDQKSFRYRIDYSSDNLYDVFIEISTKTNSVESKETKWEKGKEYYAVTDKSSGNKIRVFANMNKMSLYAARSYVEAWYKLTYCKKATEITD